MVSSNRRIVIILMFCWFSKLNAVTTVEALIDNYTAIDNEPLTGMINITHKKLEQVDLKSFKLNNQALNVTLIDTIATKKSPDEVISTFSFEQPGQKPGLYILSPISVKVGDATYQSTATSYTVYEKGSVPSSTSAAKTTKQGPVVFRLEALKEAPSPFYSGQRAQLIYRITYNRDIDLSASNLPMLYIKDLRLIGDKQIKDYQKGSFTYQDIIQEVEAIQPGRFRYGPSSIAGYAYMTDSTGQKIYRPPLIKAEAPAIELVVVPFPTENQPSSFNGMLGSIDVAVHLLSSQRVEIGDRLMVELIITGLINSEASRLPTLLCQPGFSGFFQLSDLPPAADAQKNRKTFRLEMKPISRFTKYIPSIQVSAFDPTTAQYNIQQTPPVPLDLLTAPLSSLSRVFVKQNLPENLAQFNIAIPPLMHQQAPILKMNQLQQTPFSFRWIYLLLFLIALLIYNQSYQQKKQQKPSIVLSEQLFKQAMKDINGASFFALIEQAFWQRLKEKQLADAQLKTFKEGVTPDIKNYLFDLQQKQYGPVKEKPTSKWIENTQEMFRKIG